jgi:hypothetical protein
MSTGTITCIDGSVVMVANECLNGVGATVNIGITTIINTIAGRLLSTAISDISSLLTNAQAAAVLTVTTPHPLNQLPSKTTIAAILNANPTAMSEISKLMLAGISTIVPTTNSQANALSLGNPGVTISGTATRKASNAAENLFNQLINGSPTSLLSIPSIHLPSEPALGIA